ncbi:MAG: hypothetical protein K2P58_15810 [Hyphomonadaceae bacterium]|nr:hypothetical protein [Hyphomonadaceae bacterium]
MSIWKWLGAGALCLALALVFWRPLDVMFAFPPALPEAHARAEALRAAAGRPGDVLCTPERVQDFLNAARAYAAAVGRSGRAWPDYYAVETEIDAAERLLIGANLGARVPAVSLAEASFNYEKLRTFENPEVLARSPREVREACAEIIDFWSASGVRELTRLQIQRERARLEPRDPEAAGEVLSTGFGELSRLSDQVSRAEAALIARLRKIREVNTPE